ncbi:MAG TPA: PSD1 and planctomycete cytochrome C domain-containing protein [Candidatus Saccharimonadales bacterium]|nr:PSD1 and planctomycete cytochrome C domain-containing protein [Candidatus Saccharimonadales bacterium]
MFWLPKAVSPALLKGCMVGWCAFLSLSAAAYAQNTQDKLDYFERKVRPLLAENCFSCHGPEKQKGKLRLDSTAAIRSGGENGPILVPGRPEVSRVILAVRYVDEDLKMPPKTRLNDRQVDDLVEWVKQGAAMPVDKGPVVLATAGKETEITAKDRAHWAFQPLKRHRVPVIPKQETSRFNPIDAFILSQLEKKRLAPNPPADKRQLVRRAYYDLTGLPPTASEVETFLGDKSPRAWASLIDRLLESPRYGEKWGRHWLDLVRYAESNSYERDNPKPNAWRYRDYVIRSFNEDKPYDRFVSEQLAGDEFPQRTDDSIIATGFYRLGIWDDEPADSDLARYDALDDILTTTGQVFLGLTVDCARCHNHKQDPIPQADYYRLLAFFQNIAPFKNGGPTDEIPLCSNPAEKALAVTEPGSKAPDTFVLLRGNPKTRGEQVEPGFLQVLGSARPKISSHGQSTGRRTALAHWIASSENPLTARVMANRLWQHHFGRGLVRSPNNFGLQGDAPTHPELLDWLATDLMANGWYLKPLHRLIMNSQAYQMSSSGRAEALKSDAANDSYWRFDMRRLTAEEIRDSILALNGSLSLKMAGPGIYTDIPKEVLAGQSRPGNGWGKSSAEEQARRSVYIHVKRSLLTPILESFDEAETDRSTPVRFATVQPTQALGMLNSEFLNQQAGIFASRLRREAGVNLHEQVRLGLALVTTRQPTRQEISRGEQLVRSLVSKDNLSPELALKYFCLMALNLNEMVYLD